MADIRAGNLDSEVEVAKVDWALRAQFRGATKLTRDLLERLNRAAERSIHRFAFAHARRNGFKMKSAYELAMERLEKKAPSMSLTQEQKEQIAEIDSSYRAKIAEKELFLKDQIRKAQIGGSFDEAESLEKQRSIEVRRLQEDCEEKKEKLRAQFAK